MNMQKMGKLCKENMSMKLYRKGCTQYISDGITTVEIPRNFPALCDENEFNEDGSYNRYCGNCGQAIDWDAEFDDGGDRLEDYLQEDAK